jgi:predicted dehydrogenase
VTTDSYSVGIVGCGWMGRAHADAYRDHDQTTVVAAAATSASAREAFAADYEVESTYDDYAAMLADTDLDALSVCTWHETHARIVVDGAEAGVDGIVCEKPMATSLGEADDMLDAAERNDVKLTIAHQRRFDPVHERARTLVAEGAVGEPQVVTGRWHSGLLNLGCHVVDLARFVLGDPDYAWVSGQIERRTDRHEREVAIEDRAVGHVCFADGTRLTYESDMPGPDVGDGVMQIHGSGGVLDVDLGTSLTVTNADGVTEYAPDAETDSRARYLAAFVEWLDGARDDHRCSGVHGRDVIEVLMAMYESARTRRVVEPPLETRANPLHVMIEDGDLPVEAPGAYDIRLPYASVRSDQ